MAKSILMGAGSSSVPTWSHLLHNSAEAVEVRGAGRACLIVPARGNLTVPLSSAALHSLCLQRGCLAGLRPNSTSGK